MSSSEGQKELRFPVGKGWSLWMKNVEPQKGAQVEYANNEGNFFKVTLGSVDIQAPNTPEWTTIAGSNSLDILNIKDRYFQVHLGKGKGEYPVIIENPNHPEKKDEVAVVWSIDRVTNTARIGIETEYPAQVSSDRIFPQDRVIRKSVNNPDPNRLFQEDFRPVKLAANVHLHPGLISTGVDLGTIIDTSGNLSTTSVEWTEVVNTVDGIGQAALGLSIAEAAKDPQVSAAISRALIFHINNSPKTQRPATLSDDMQRVRDASYVVTIDSKEGEEWYRTDVAGTAAVAAGFYPRGNFSVGKGYFAPGIKLDGSLDVTLAMHVDPQNGQIRYVTDNHGSLLDASEISEDTSTLGGRKTLELGRVLTNSQRIVGSTGTNIQLVEGKGHTLEPLSHLVNTDNAPLMATLYRAIAFALNNPLNPYAKDARESIISTLQHVNGR